MRRPVCRVYIGDGDEVIVDVKDMHRASLERIVGAVLRTAIVAGADAAEILRRASETYTKERNAGP